MKYNIVTLSFLVSAPFLLDGAAKRPTKMMECFNVLPPIGEKGDMPCMIAYEPNLVGDKIVALLVGDEQLLGLPHDVAKAGLKEIVDGSGVLSDGFVVPGAKDYDVRSVLASPLFQGSGRPDIVALFLLSKEQMSVQVLPVTAEPSAEPTKFVGDLNSVVYITSNGVLEDLFAKTKSRDELVKEGYTDERIKQLFMSFVDAHDYRIAVTFNADAVKSYFDAQDKRKPCFDIPVGRRSRAKKAGQARL